MAKQGSIVKFEGKMDGISFYKKKGNHFARKASGPSKQRILTDPKFERTRENLKEFGGLALTVKSFSDTLNRVANLSSSNLRNKTVKIFRMINKRSMGIRGQRPVEISKNRELLKNLEINSTSTLGEVFAARFTMAHSAERSSASVSIQESSVREMISAPPNGTHFRLVHLVGAIADTVYDEPLAKYVPADLFFNSLNEVTFSDYLPARSNEALVVNLETTLSNIPPVGENVSIIQGLGIIFYEQIGDVYYPLAQNTAMKIVDVF